MTDIAWKREKLPEPEERQIITLMITQTDFLKQVYDKRPSAAFTTPFVKTVTKWIEDYFGEFQTAPGHHIESIFLDKSRNGLDPDQAALIKIFLSSISKEYEERTEPDPYDVKRFNQYLKRQHAARLSEKTAEALETGNLALVDELIADFQKKTADVETFGTVYIVGDDATAQEVRAMMDGGHFPEGTVLKDVPPIKRLAGSDVVLVNCKAEVVEQLQVPYSLGSLKPIRLPLDGEHREFSEMIFRDAVDVARRNLRKALSSDEGIKFIEPFTEFGGYPETEKICGPISASSLNYIFSMTGVGKTWLTMSIAVAAAKGVAPFEGWDVPKKRKVLYIDGEMPCREIEDRIQKVGLAENCHILSKMKLEMYNVEPALDFANEEIREIVEGAILAGGYDLVVFDNIYSLIHTMDSNSSDAWYPINEWLLRLRGKGVATLLDHHSGKSGKQLGTESRLFNANLVLKLVENPEKIAGDPCSFTIQIPKGRSNATRGIEGKMYTCNDGKWTVAQDKKTSTEDRNAKVLRMIVAGKGHKEIAELIDVTIGTVSNVRKKLVGDGFLFDGEGKTSKKAGVLTEAGREWLDNLSFSGEE